MWQRGCAAAKPFMHALLSNVLGPCYHSRNASLHSAAPCCIALQSIAASRSGPCRPVRALWLHSRLINCTMQCMHASPAKPKVLLQKEHACMPHEFGKIEHSELQLAHMTPYVFTHLLACRSACLSVISPLSQSHVGGDLIFLLISLLRAAPDLLGLHEQRHLLSGHWQTIRLQGQTEHVRFQYVLGSDPAGRYCRQARQSWVREVAY